MDITQYRLDQFEKRADAADARMARIEDKLTEMQVTMATLATKDNVRNWCLAVVIAILAIGVSVGGIVVASSSNQLSAFQASLSAIQTIAAEQQLAHTAPLATAKSGN